MRLWKETANLFIMNEQYHMHDSSFLIDLLLLPCLGCPILLDQCDEGCNSCLSVFIVEFFSILKDRRGRVRERRQSQEDFLHVEAAARWSSSFLFSSNLSDAWMNIVQSLHLDDWSGVIWEHWSWDWIDQAAPVPSYPVHLLCAYLSIISIILEPRPVGFAVISIILLDQAWWDEEAGFWSSSSNRQEIEGGRALLCQSFCAVPVSWGTYHILVLVHSCLVCNWRDAYLLHRRLSVVPNMIRCDCHCLWETHLSCWLYICMCLFG